MKNFLASFPSKGEPLYPSCPFLQGPLPSKVEALQIPSIFIAFVYCVDEMAWFYPKELLMACERHLRYDLLKYPTILKRIPTKYRNPILREVERGHIESYEPILSWLAEVFEVQLIAPSGKAYGTQYPRCLGLVYQQGRWKLLHKSCNPFFSKEDLEKLI